MNARKLMVCVAALVAASIAWFPMSPPAEAAPSPAFAAAPMVCDFDCRCTVVLGTPNDEDVQLLCYDSVMMSLLSSTTGCCDGSATCTQADDCSWTVKISVLNATQAECCYEIIKDGVDIFEDSCTDSFDHQDSDSAACGDSHLYVLRGEGAECPSDEEADCLLLMNNVKLWEQRVHCQADGAECPPS